MAMYTVTAFVRPRKSGKAFVKNAIVIDAPSLPSNATATTLLRTQRGYEVSSIVSVTTKLH